MSSPHSLIPEEFVEFLWFSFNAKLVVLADYEGANLSREASNNGKEFFLITLAESLFVEGGDQDGEEWWEYLLHEIGHILSLGVSSLLTEEAIAELFKCLFVYEGDLEEAIKAAKYYCGQSKEVWIKEYNIPADSDFNWTEAIVIAKKNFQQKRVQKMRKLFFGTQN